MIEIKDSLKFRVFSDLTSRKHLFLANGLKFGADYLAYKGDPMLFHADYLVKIVLSSSISTTDLLCYERLANSVKKTLLLAWQNNSCLDYVLISYNN